VGQGGGQLIGVIRQVLPGPRRARHAGLATEAALDADFPGHGGDLLGEGGQGAGHLVDGFRQGGNLPLGLEDDFGPQVTVGDRRHHPGDAAHLVGQVAGHHIYVVGEVLPDAGPTLDVGLPAQLAIGADLAGHARDLAGEGVQLVDHGVDRVLELQDLAPDVNGDLLGQVALGHRGGDFGDVAHLGGEVAGHVVHAVGEVLPRPTHPSHPGLPAQLAFGADLAGHPGDLAGEGVQLVDHGADGVLELQDLAAYVDRDLPRQVAAGYGGGDLRDVAHLGGQIGGQLVDVVRKVLPDTGHAPHLGLPAQLALGPHLPGHPSDLSGEAVELVDHDVDRVLEFQDLAADIHRNLLGQVAFGHGRRDVGDVAHLRREIARHGV